MNEQSLLDAVDRQFVSMVSPTAPRAGAGGHPCQGLYWTPKGKQPNVAFIATHYNVDFAEHYIAPHLASRGYGFLGWNTRFRGNEDMFTLEHALIDLGEGVRWLREHAGIEQIVILGNSGGGSLMGAYQSQVIKLDLEPTPSGRVLEALHNLPGADLYISLNAHPGRPDVLTNWIDASVTDEWDPLATDPALDPFNPDNGPPYSAEFVEKYRAAQKARNQRITDWAKSELKRLNDAGYVDRIFPFTRAWADLRFIDPALEPSDRPCPLCYAGEPAQANRRPFVVGRANTLRGWLSMWSLETSQCRGEPHLSKIQLPSLVVQSTADTGVFRSDAQAIYGAIAAEDKTLEFIPGAHYFEDSLENRTNMVDLLCAWTQART